MFGRCLGIEMNAESEIELMCYDNCTRVIEKRQTLQMWINFVEYAHFFRRSPYTIRHSRFHNTTQQIFWRTNIGFHLTL